MTQTIEFSAEDRRVLHDALSKGEADKAFAQLADYLQRNRLQLSDETMRRYARDELFACFSGRGAAFLVGIQNAAN